MIPGRPPRFRLDVGSRVLVVLVLAAVALAEGPAAKPSRAATGAGRLRARVVESSTDCVEADPPPARRCHPRCPSSVENEVTLQMGL